ncbi:MAG TPA: BatA domain-containing protein [Verrucomicrobiae bacterium]|nr:BatA domain-containing protein [Verrucomicrobiae bacterium]
MTFLQPFILWGLPLLLVPIIIHLVNRMRHRTVHWAAMQFLLQATQSSTSHAKLRQFLILALRVLAVIAMILFLARPLAGGWLGWALAPAPDSILLLLDRSASMEARVAGGTQSKREAAVQRFIEAAQVFEKSSHVVLIDSATRSPQEITVTSLANLHQVAATDTAADLPGMLQAAVKWLVDTRSGAAEIWIASDLQESNWSPEDGRWKSTLDQFRALPQKVRFRVLSFESPGEANAAVSLAEIVRRDRAGQASLAYVLDLQRATASTDPMPLTVTLGEARLQTEVKSEGTSIRWRSSLPLDATRTTGWGAFELPADTNPRDNAAYFVYGERMPLSATVVAANPEASKILSFAASDAAKPATVVRPEDAASMDLAAQALVIWQTTLPTGNVADRLRAFTEEGGVILFLPPTESSAAAIENVSWGEIEMTRTNAFQLARWDEDQGPLARTEERISLPVASVEVLKRQKISGAAQVLAAFSDGSTFLARKTIGRGEIYFCSSLPANDWSTLSDGDVLVPMLQRMLQSGARRLQNAVMATCGDLPAGLAQMSWTGVSEGARDPKLHAGVYKSGNRLLAVNRPATEDEPERLESSRAMALFGDLPAQVFRDVGSRADQLQGEIWRLFLFGMLLFLLAEGWLILPQTRRPENPPKTAKPRQEAAVAS